jgi:hypothetical protein
VSAHVGARGTVRPVRSLGATALWNNFDGVSRQLTPEFGTVW